MTYVFSCSALLDSELVFLIPHYHVYVHVGYVYVGFSWLPQTQQVLNNVTFPLTLHPWHIPNFSTVLLPILN